MVEFGAITGVGLLAVAILRLFMPGTKEWPLPPGSRSQRRGAAEVVARLSATGDWAGTFVQEDRCGCLKSLHLCGWVDALTSAKR